MVAANEDWDPPLCWMQPKYTGKEMKDESEEMSENLPSGVDARGGIDDYHEDEEGAWWYRTYDVRRERDDKWAAAMRECGALGDSIQWVPDGDALPDMAISPVVLSMIAFRYMTLPAPPVTLSPSADNQKVNLETHATFHAPLDRVWVTATFQDFGLDIAATTVATPTELRIDAGTGHADPKFCTYSLDETEEGYKVNTAEENCNITYRQSSGGDTYPLQVQIVWDITWTATDNPDGPPQQPAIPDGLSTDEVEVTVQEIQTIVR
ncbi:hypothetical protein JJV70_03500 [Streptomyces sp. JJ66]|uniref:hypothetical protein n=1 Tax=Streptomyces sp. JJ66 TaxID=2803843 RepID=UPI001C59B98B|nr:hypothetical protein [Streptomyces sp. JJ66]MBW1601182.1 hypothetical protein [Streptomyces sp. JJ66]